MRLCLNNEAPVKYGLLVAGARDSGGDTNIDSRRYLDCRNQTKNDLWIQRPSWKYWAY
jgi:hypothetical protein